MMFGGSFFGVSAAQTTSLCLCVCELVTHGKIRLAKLTNNEKNRKPAPQPRKNRQLRDLRRVPKTKEFQTRMIQNNSVSRYSKSRSGTHLDSTL